jgi:hypothetical protein
MPVALKVGRMKAIIIALLILVAAESILQAALCSPDFNGMKPWSSGPNVDTKSIESKLADALQGLSATQKGNNPNSAATINSSAANLTAINSTSVNSTAVNSTEINTTAINASEKDADHMELEGSSGSVSLSGSSSASSQGVASDSKASFKGFWGMESNQKVIGKSGINSKTYLSGDFEVDKTVKFQDRG